MMQEGEQGSGDEENVSNDGKMAYGTWQTQQGIRHLRGNQARKSHDSNREE